MYPKKCPLGFFHHRCGDAGTSVAWIALCTALIKKPKKEKKKKERRMVIKVAEIFFF